MTKYKINVIVSTEMSTYAQTVAEVDNNIDLALSTYENNKYLFCNKLLHSDVKGVCLVECDKYFILKECSDLSGRRVDY